MHALVLLGASAFLLCLVLTPVCRNLFLHFGLVDQPDTQRKLHLRAVPRVGGIPIAISYAAALGIAFWLHPGGKIYIQHWQLFRALLPAAAIIFTTGLLDDLFTLKPWQKLAGQFVAASLAVWLGARLAILPTHPSVSVVLSVMWLIGCSNAINLVDGMDGLATGVSLLATLTSLTIGLLSGNVGLTLATVPLAGCLLAFLRYNFSPASVFLGDCGSLTIGFIIGCFGLIWSQSSGGRIGLLAPLMALALPLIDVVLAIGRRFLRRIPITQADRGHIHHMVLKLGFSTRKAAFVLYAACGFCASSAILVSVSNNGLHWPILLIFICFTLIGIDRLGYVEFVAARKAFTYTFRRRTVQDHIILEELDRALLQTRNLEEWWAVVISTTHALAFTSVRMEFQGDIYHEVLHESSFKSSCRIHLNLGEEGILVLTRPPEKVAPRSIMAVLQRFQESFEDKNFVQSSNSSRLVAPKASTAA